MQSSEIRGLTTFRTQTNLTSEFQQSVHFASEAHLAEPHSPQAAAIQILLAPKPC